MRTVNIKHTNGEEAVIPLTVARSLVASGHAKVIDSKPAPKPRRPSRPRASRAKTPAKKPTGQGSADAVPGTDAS